MFTLQRGTFVALWYILLRRPAGVTLSSPNPLGNNLVVIVVMGELQM